MTDLQWLCVVSGPGTLEKSRKRIFLTTYLLLCCHTAALLCFHRGGGSSRDPPPRGRHTFPRGYLLKMLLFVRQWSLLIPSSSSSPKVSPGGHPHGHNNKALGCNERERSLWLACPSFYTYYNTQNDNRILFAPLM